jgi:hypothetical protein
MSSENEGMSQGTEATSQAVLPLALMLFIIAEMH